MIPFYYEFLCPVKIISGKRAIENLPNELDTLQVKNPLIITDKGIILAGIIDLIKEVFKEYNAKVPLIYDNVPPDSSNRTVMEIVDIYTQNRCDSLVAVGGGSVIDTAKGVDILVSEGERDLMKFAGANILTRPLHPLIVIPTTSGTGSEVTVVAMIYNEERGIKMAFSSPYLLPRVAILDPRMTLTLPPHITAATAMDALTHAIEAFLCIQKNPLSDSFATSAIKLIRENLYAAVMEGKEQNARLALANAATMAGIAFSNSMVGMIHSLGHATGSVSKIPHGVAMSIFLPYGLKYNLDVSKEHIARLLLYIGGEEVYARTSEENRAQKCIEIVCEIREKLHQLCGLPTSLKEAGVEEDMLPAIAGYAIDDPSILFNPREMDFDGALSILKAAYKGEM